MRLPDETAAILRKNNDLSMEATRNKQRIPDHKPVVHAKGRDPMGQAAEFFMSEYDPWQDAYFCIIQDSSGVRAEWVTRLDLSMYAPMSVDTTFEAMHTMREKLNEMRSSN